MSKQLDRQLLKVLKKVRRHVRKRLKKGKRVPHAICFLVTVMNGIRDWEQHDRLKALFAKWPKFSGIVQYPVPSPKADQACNEKYMIAREKDAFWNGKYGRLRMELLEWMISYLEAKHGKA